jgi:hypothetical protein
MGRDDETEGRNGWPLAALKKAKEKVTEVRDAVIDRIETATEYSTDASSGAAAAPEDDGQGDRRRPDEAWDADDVDWGDPFSSSG